MSILDYACWFAMLCFTLANVLALFRAMKGPSAQDRVLSADVTYINCMLMIFTLGIIYRTPWYFDIGLLISLFGFAGTLGMAKFLLRGEVISP